MQLIAVLILLLFSVGVYAEDKKQEHTDKAVEVCLPPKPGMTADECIVRYFKDSQEASIIRGRIVFQNYCTLCHGKEGKGDGRAARLHNPRPYNLTQSLAPRDYISQVIRKGGEAMGRGKGMPPWGEQLTDEQINDTLNFLWSIRVSQ